MATKTARDLSGPDIGRTVTVSPAPGFTIIDEIRSVIHGSPLGGIVEHESTTVWVRFKNVIPTRAFEMGDRGDGFRFDGNDIVEVQD